MPLKLRTLYAWNETMREMEDAIYVLNLSLGSNP